MSHYTRIQGPGMMGFPSMSESNSARAFLGFPGTQSLSTSQSISTSTSGQNSATSNSNASNNNSNTNNSSSGNVNNNNNNNIYIYSATSNSNACNNSTSTNSSSSGSLNNNINDIGSSHNSVGCEDHTAQAHALTNASQSVTPSSGPPQNMVTLGSPQGMSLVSTGDADANIKDAIMHAEKRPRLM